MKKQGLTTLDFHFFFYLFSVFFSFYLFRLLFSQELYNLLDTVCPNVRFFIGGQCRSCCVYHRLVRLLEILQPVQKFVACHVKIPRDRVITEEFAMSVIDLELLHDKEVSVVDPVFLSLSAVTCVICHFFVVTDHCHRIHAVNVVGKCHVEKAVLFFALAPTHPPVNAIDEVLKLDSNDVVEWYPLGFTAVDGRLIASEFLVVFFDEVKQAEYEETSPAISVLWRVGGGVSVCQHHCVSVEFGVVDAVDGLS